MELNYIIEICVAIDIAILGIAYPIIIDRISNIGEKYSSEYLSNLFDKTFLQRKVSLLGDITRFQLVLYATIISFAFLIFQFEPLFGWDNWFINNSAKLTIFLLTIVWVISFFILLNRFAIYNGKSTYLLRVLINQYKNNKIKKKDNQFHLKTINEFCIYAIVKDDPYLQLILSDFYFDEFYEIREEYETERLLDNSDFYFIVYKIIEESIKKDRSKLSDISKKAISGWWLLGEDSKEIEISENTYNVLWQNLLLFSGAIIFFREYWSSFSQYYTYQLKPVEQQRNYENFEVINKEEVKKREKERNRFLEFHYAVGGLVLHAREVKSLKYMFEYSSSIPPQQVLLPHSMDEIFYWFIWFNNDFAHNPPLDIKYRFPEFDNLGNSKMVTHNICKYIALLFIRQYTLIEYYTFDSFTSPLKLSDNSQKLQELLNNLPYFESCLTQILQDKAMLDELDYTKIVEDKKEDFFVYIGDTREQIKEKIKIVAIETPLSKTKLKEFNDISKKILEEAFGSYSDIFRIKDDTDNIDERLKLTVTGGKTLMSKSAFVDDSNHITFHSDFATRIKNESIGRYIPNSFFAARTQRYLLNEDNIVDGLDQIIHTKSDIKIVAINLRYELEEKINKYKDRIIKINSSERNVYNLLFVLDNSDLPSIEHKELKEEILKKDQLEQLSEKYYIYSSIIDINTPENKNIKEEWDIKSIGNEDDLKVQVTIAFLSIIYWKIDREIIQIRIYSPYLEQGIQNEIDDLKPLKEK